MKKSLIIIFLFTYLLGQKISVQLDWKYQFEFAGYIVAKEKGFYKKEGLDVKLVQYHNNDIVKDVLDGKYDFGIYDNNLINYKIEGKPVKLVASIFKRSALVLIVKPNIKNLKQLEYKTLMVADKDKKTFEEFLSKNGVDVCTIKFIPTNYSIEPFVDGKVDGFSAFITDEVYLLEQKKVSFNIINPSDYNFLMYQGELFSRKSFTDNNPILVDKFKKATIKGWYYALNHKQETAKIIYDKYTKRKSMSALLNEAQKLETIIERYIYPIGFIDKSLLKAQFRYEMKLLNKDINIHNFPQKSMSDNLNLDDMVNDYIFSFQNPLNLPKKYLFVIKLYNFYLQNRLFLIASFVFFSLFSLFLFFYLKLQQEKKKIETLFNKAPIGYVLIEGEEHIIKRANDFAYKMFEYPLGQELKMSSKYFHISEEKYKEFKKLMMEYIDKNGTIEGFSVIWQVKTYKGKHIWVNIQALLYSSTEILWIFIDVDEIMKTQHKLDKQIKQTQRAMRVKEEFLANMSHEIRTPLNAILGFVDIIKRKEQDEENKKYLDIISKSGKSLLTIINDILDFSKIESGKLKIEKIEFNPKEEFETIISLFESKSHEKNINLHINFSNLDYNIISDPTRIKQVISNFISNAIKFTPEGKNIYCNINYNSQTEKLYVEVIDEGIGIDKEKLDTIFKPFAQADSSTTRKYGGTGLGLTISKKLVEFLGGNLRVSSEVGKGSKFYFSIPAKKTTKITTKIEKMEKYNENFKFDDYKILIVEDNKANQLFLKVTLNSLGIKNIDIANDGLEAIEMVKQKHYDIILMDENMPNMNGLEASKQIKKMKIDTPIIAVTANALSGDKEKFLDVMDGYLSKPIEKDKLIEVLKNYLK